MVYFCRYAECVSQTVKAKIIVFHIVFCIWITSSSIHIYTLNQHIMSTNSQNKNTCTETPSVSWKSYLNLCELCLCDMLLCNKMYNHCWDYTNIWEGIIVKEQDNQRSFCGDRRNFFSVDSWNIHTKKTMNMIFTDDHHELVLVLYAIVLLIWMFFWVQKKFNFPPPLPNCNCWQLS